MKIKVTNADLHKIFDYSKTAFIDKDNRQLDGREFVVRCYIESCVAFLNNAGCNIELDFDIDNRHETVRDDD